MLKLDISDGFYRIPVRDEDIPALDVVPPHRPGEESFIAFPLVLLMSGLDRITPHILQSWISRTATSGYGTRHHIPWKLKQEGVKNTKPKFSMSKVERVHSLPKHDHDERQADDCQ
jgi:hypothetical protein